MNYTVEKLDSKAINFGSLNGFSVLCIPGGDMYRYTEDINIEGRRNIRNFIEEGGGYLCICGGAYFSLNKVVWRGRTLPMETLRLVSGIAIGPLDELPPYPEYAMIKVTSREKGKSFFNDLNEAFWVLYYWGPALNLDDNSQASILGVYADNELPVLVTSEHGKGRVVLVGVHPGIEEDSIRDGSTWGSELDEKGSDWPRLKRLIKWLDN